MHAFRWAAGLDTPAGRAGSRTGRMKNEKPAASRLGGCYDNNNEVLMRYLLIACAALLSGAALAEPATQPTLAPDKVLVLPFVALDAAQPDTIGRGIQETL